MIRSNKIGLHDLDPSVFESLNTDEVLPIEKGGTGTSSAEEALANLGALSKNAVVLADGEILTLLQNSGDSTIFFTNWYDSTNFPAVYGSGVFINATDKREKRLLYVCNQKMFFGMYSTVTNTITWKEAFTTEGGTLSGHYISLGNGQVLLQNHNGALTLTSFDTSNDGNNCRYLDIHAPKNLGLISAFGFCDVNNGISKRYTMFGEHNTELLATHIQTLLQGGNVSMVKNIQRGTVSMNSDSSTTITLNGFSNVNKMLVLLDGNTGQYSTGSASSRGIAITPYLQALTVNQLTITCPDTYFDYNISGTISYQVIEFC